MWVAGWHVPYGKLLFKLLGIQGKNRFLGAKPFTDTDSCVRHTLGPEKQCISMDLLALQIDWRAVSPSKWFVPQEFY